jgi:hypothetical protein
MCAEVKERAAKDRCCVVCRSASPTGIFCPSGQRCEAFLGENLLGFRPKGPFDCLARAIGPGKAHQQLTRPEGPFVCCEDKQSTLWASVKMSGLQTRAGGPG